VLKTKRHKAYSYTWLHKWHPHDAPMASGGSHLQRPVTNLSGHPTTSCQAHYVSASSVIGVPLGVVHKALKAFGMRRNFAGCAMLFLTELRHGAQ